MQQKMVMEHTWEVISKWKRSWARAETPTVVAETPWGPSDSESPAEVGLQQWLYSNLRAFPMVQFSQFKIFTESRDQGRGEVLKFGGWNGITGKESLNMDDIKAKEKGCRHVTILDWWKQWLTAWLQYLRWRPIYAVRIVSQRLAVRWKGMKWNR